MGRTFGVAARAAFARRAKGLSVVLKTWDNEQHDVLDTDAYVEDIGGMVASAWEVAGADVKGWVGDSTRPWATTVRAAEDEVRRTLGRRALNPKWLAGIEAHGYQGGSEMLNMKDSAFGFDATMDVLEDWVYGRFAAAYVSDPERQAFLLRHNPWALRDMARRLVEAGERGLWGAPPGIVEKLNGVLLDAGGSWTGCEGCSVEWEGVALGMGGDDETARRLPGRCRVRCCLVAGEGFEPSTFGL